MSNFADVNPTVSVIVPVKNRKSLLLRCLDSIRRQSYRPLEVLVVDNGSTDDTLEVAQKWSDENSGQGFAVKVLSEPKPGACAARNLGLRNATGEYTIFFDSDDAMRPDLVNRAVAEFEKDKDVDIVCWRVDIHQLDGTVRQPPFNPQRALEDHMVNALLRTQGYIARTEAFRKAGGWNEDLMGWNDWELGVRMLLNNLKVMGINEVLVDVYSQADSITGKNFSSKAGCWEKSLEAVREDIEKCSHPEKSRLLGIVSYREIILAAHYAKEGEMQLANDLKNVALRHISAQQGKGLGSFKDRQLLSFAYEYTHRGGRGAWRMMRHLL